MRSVASYTPELRARSYDPITSHEAAVQAKDLAKAHYQIILAVLRVHGPLGKDGIARHCDLEGVQIARRLGEMEWAGLAYPTGSRVPSDTGRSEREWSAC